MSAPAHRKFAFDTVFDGDGHVASAPPPVKRVYMPAEVEQIRAQAFAEGERAADARGAAALSEIARACAAAMGSLARVAHDHREASAQLAYAVGCKIADAALERFPEAPVMGAMAELAREIDSRPVLKVQVAADLVEPIHAALARMAESIGFAGAITVVADAGLPRAAFAFDWGEGRAAFDPQSSAARVAAALETALAAEGLHAEPLISESDNGHG